MDPREKERDMGVEGRTVCTLHTSGRDKPACVPVLPLTSLALCAHTSAHSSLSPAPHPFLLLLCCSSYPSPRLCKLHLPNSRSRIMKQVDPFVFACYLSSIHPSFFLSFPTSFLLSFIPSFLPPLKGH